MSESNVCCLQVTRPTNLSEDSDWPLSINLEAASQAVQAVRLTLTTDGPNDVTVKGLVVKACAIEAISSSSLPLSSTSKHNNDGGGNDDDDDDDDDDKILIQHLLKASNICEGV